GDQAVGDVAHARAAVSVQGRTEEAQLAHLQEDLAVESLVAVRLEDARHQLFLAVLARHVADASLVVRELLVEPEWVVPREPGFCAHAACLPHFARDCTGCGPSHWNAVPLRRRLSLL